jgi:hypothetical protein
MGASESSPALEIKRHGLTLGIFQIDHLKGNSDTPGEWFVRSSPSCSRLRDLVSCGLPIIVFCDSEESEKRAPEVLHEVISLLFSPFALKEMLEDFKLLQLALGSTKVDNTLKGYIDSCHVLSLSQINESLRVLFEQKLKKSPAIIFEIPAAQVKLRNALNEYAAKTKNIKISVIERENLGISGQ